MRSIREAFLRADTVMLGDKRVKITKLTPKYWRELFEAIDLLPSLIVNVAKAPSDQFMAYALTAAEVAMDEVIEITHILTGIDRDYLENEVGLDEIIEYFSKMAEYNSLEQMLKNMKSLLPAQQEPAQEAQRKKAELQ